MQHKKVSFEITHTIELFLLSNGYWKNLAKMNAWCLASVAEKGATEILLIKQSRMFYHMTAKAVLFTSAKANLSFVALGLMSTPKCKVYFCHNSKAHCAIGLLYHFKLEVVQ